MKHKLFIIGGLVGVGIVGGLMVGMIAGARGPVAKASVYDETARLQGEIDALTARITALEGMNVRLELTQAVPASNEEMRITALEGAQVQLQTQVVAVLGQVLSTLQKNQR